jgi:hypothetical protein
VGMTVNANFRAGPSALSAEQPFDESYHLLHLHRQLRRRRAEYDSGRAAPRPHADRRGGVSWRHTFICGRAREAASTTC